ncbi:hypothetical protein ACIRBX_03440 [Kitasatospora sp. NPDC096147]|uniref:hypothetical protein n=1 Tax=Kitasatospora sp. NPDC096147 TaxID=3364093 RepID=UPI00382AB1B3
MPEPRYEPRPLPRQGDAPQLWGAWDTLRGDWLRRPGTGCLAGTPEPFTTSQRVRLWAGSTNG